MIVFFEYTGGQISKFKQKLPMFKEIKLFSSWKNTSCIKLKILKDLGQGHGLIIQKNGPKSQVDHNRKIMSKWYTL